MIQYHHTRPSCLVYHNLFYPEAKSNYEVLSRQAQSAKNNCSKLHTPTTELPPSNWWIYENWVNTLQCLFLYLPVITDEFKMHQHLIQKSTNSSIALLDGKENYGWAGRKQVLGKSPQNFPSHPLCSANNDVAGAALWKDRRKIRNTTDWAVTQRWTLLQVLYETSLISPINDVKNYYILI